MVTLLAPQRSSLATMTIWLFRRQRDWLTDTTSRFGIGTALLPAYPHIKGKVTLPSCPPSPRTAGTSITGTCMSARSRAVSVVRSTSTNWNGAAVSIRGSRPMSTRDGLAAFRHVKPERFQSKSKVERIQRLLVVFRRTVARADHRTEIAMSNQNQNNPGVQNEGSKPDLDELTRKAQKE